MPGAQRSSALLSAPAPFEFASRSDLQIGEEDTGALEFELEDPRDVSHELDDTRSARFEVTGSKC